MSFNAAGNILREIMKDRQTCLKSSPIILYSTHLKALDSWYAELPIYLCLRAPTSGRIGTVDPESNERQMTAIFNVHALFLGIVCELLQPALGAIMHAFPISSCEDLELYANRWYKPFYIRWSHPLFEQSH
jgi:hypothetical protein